MEDRLRRRRERDRLRREEETPEERDARLLNWLIASMFILKLYYIDWPDVEYHQHCISCPACPPYKFDRNFYFTRSFSIKYPCLYCLSATRDTQHYHFILPPVSMTSHLASYNCILSRTIKEWKNLPTSILEPVDDDTFYNHA